MLDPAGQQRAQLRLRELLRGSRNEDLPPRQRAVSAHLGFGRDGRLPAVQQVEDVETCAAG